MKLFTQACCVGVGVTVLGFALAIPVFAVVACMINSAVYLATKAGL